MNLIETIRNVITEQLSGGAKLRKYAKKNGLEDAVKLVGGLENYIKFAYNGDLSLYYKHESDIAPFVITGNPPVMFLDNLLVQSLNLPERNGYKVLGNFKYGTKKSMPKNVEARLKQTSDGTWVVVAVGGNTGFGLTFIYVGNILGPKERKQIYKQIIEKYNLENYL